MMQTEYFDRFFTFAAAGLGLLLAGGLNFALGQNGRRVWLRAGATLAVCGAVVAGLSAFTRPELALRASWVLVSVLGVVTLLGSAWFSRQLTNLITFLHKPAARWGLVAAGGLAVILGSGIAFDRADETAMDQGMKELDLAVGRSPSQTSERARATTDKGTQVVLKEPTNPRAVADLAIPEGKTLRESRYAELFIRRGVPTDHSNCHGWVFTGGKFLLSPDDVELIIKENGYQETHEPRPGDLVIYRQGGTIAHSAVVCYVREGYPVIVEGKWGAMGVFWHEADQSFYGKEYTFYRSARAGHLLAGVGGSPAPATETAHTTDE